MGRVMANVDGVELRYEHGLWLGDVVLPAYGHIEAVLDGDVNGPSDGHAEALRRFLKDPEGIVAEMRKKLRWAFLYRPIRVAPNMENRLGVQFMNRLTGNQSRLIQE
jgi:hypothetical protein